MAWLLCDYGPGCWAGYWQLFASSSQLAGPAAPGTVPEGAGQ
jgi:hypothetical protein